MSRGAGAIEARIADLFAATRDRALSIGAITDHAFALAGKPPTRAQRLSATRAAHRLLRRVRDDYTRFQKLRDQTHDRIEAVLGPGVAEWSDEYEQTLKSDPAWIKAQKLLAHCKSIGTWMRFIRAGRDRVRGEVDHWCTTTVNGRLFFHPPDVPVRVWAVALGPGGITWAAAEVIRITTRNVLIRYAGTTARLDREKLWHWWAFWRGVRFVSSQTGRIADELDQLWRHRYARAGETLPPAMRMPLAEAIALLHVPADYSEADVLAAFRREAKKAHPDVGGTAEMFRRLVEARDRLLTALGTSAPPPKPPSYTPSGYVTRYGQLSSSSRRIGSTRLIR